MDALTRLTLRTLNLLYGGFWLAILIYVLVLVAVPEFAGGNAKLRMTATGAVANWDQWQFFLSALALASVYLSYRLRPMLLHPRRILRGAENLHALSLRYRTPSESAEGTDRNALTRALQDVFSRLVGRFVVLWILVEIPAVLGILDRVVTGDVRLFLALTLLSAVGLFVQRPTRERLGGSHAG